MCFHLLDLTYSQNHVCVHLLDLTYSKDYACVHLLDLTYSQNHVCALGNTRKHEPERSDLRNAHTCGPGRRSDLRDEHTHGPRTLILSTSVAIRVQGTMLSFHWSFILKKVYSIVFCRTLSREQYLRKLPIIIVVRNRRLGEGKDVKKDLATICGHVCHLRHLEMTSLDITSQTKDSQLECSFSIR
jgi:hypothetical protein